MTTSVHASPRNMVAAGGGPASTGNERLNWWLSAASAAARGRAHRGFPTLSHAVLGRAGAGTCVVARRRRHVTTHVLVVDPVDANTYTGSRAGEWLAVAAVSRDRQGPHRRAGYALPSLLIGAGVLATATAAAGAGGSSMNTVWAIVLAVLLLPAGIWLAVHRRRRHQVRVWGGDDDATDVAGLDAARAALRPGRPRLYKTVVHEWLRARTISDPDNRFTRLARRADLG